MHKYNVLLQEIIQYFYKGSLNFCLEAEHIEIMTWDWQQDFLNHTIKSELVKKFPIRSEFTRLFLKKIILHLEPSQEVHDDFYTHLCMVMNEPNTSFSYRHYVIGNDLSNIVTIKETKNMVVNGTTGMKTWEAALMISDWALCNKDKFANKNILELGSGVGFTGITIAKFCNVKSILLSDCHDDVLKTACENIQINFPDYKLDKTSDRSLFKNEGSSLGAMMLDWNNIEDLPDTIVPDILIGADIVYDPSILQPLCNVIEAFSKRNKNIDVYIASVVRNDETFNSFLAALNSANLIYEKIYLDKSVYIKWDEEVKRCLLKINLRL